MLIDKYDLEVTTPPCDPGVERFNAIARLTADISQVFPYLNVTWKGAIYDHANRYLTWRWAARRLPCAPTLEGNAMPKKSYRQILVGRFMSGMSGLDEMFEELYETGRAPDESLVPELLARARKDNYIPATGEADYATALLREYRKYCQQRKSSVTRQTGYGTWRGIPREQIPWFPTLYEDLCDDCGKCVTFCPEKVFAFTEDDHRVYVASPLKCQVGCTECARICPQKAISFPPRTVLQTVGG